MIINSGAPIQLRAWALAPFVLWETSPCGQAVRGTTTLKFKMGRLVLSHMTVKINNFFTNMHH